MDIIAPHFSGPWFAVQVRTGREQTTATNLRDRGYAVCAPWYWELRRWSDRTKKVKQPLFSGYLFCSSNVVDILRTVSTPGVIRVVGSRDGPIEILENEMCAIRRIDENGLSAEPWPFLKPGQEVSIDDGPLSGLRGTIVTVRNTKRLVVAVSLLRRSVAVELSTDAVSPVGSRIELREQAQPQRRDGFHRHSPTSKV